MNNAAKFKRIKLTPADVMKPMIALLFVNIILLTVWTIIDPRNYHIVYVDLDDFGRVVETKSSCSSEHQIIFMGVLGGINLGSLAFTLVQAYQARKISTEYSESNCIFVAMVSHSGALYLAISSYPSIHSHSICSGLFFTHPYLASQSSLLPTITLRQFTFCRQVFCLLFAVRFCYSYSSPKLLRQEKRRIHPLPLTDGRELGRIMAFVRAYKLFH